VQASAFNERRIKGRLIMSDTASKTERPAGEIRPRPEAFAELIARHSGPVVMLNLLKFKTDAGDGRTGMEAYAAYGDAATEMIRSRGGEVLWAGRPEAVLVGGSGDEWDMIALVRYPSPRVLADGFPGNRWRLCCRRSNLYGFTNGNTPVSTSPGSDRVAPGHR
jgi:hypothetical protein